MERLLFIFIVLCLIFPINAEATPYTAASCNNTAAQPHVQNAVNLATVAGDVVKIPNGTCAWTQRLTITRDIVLQGENSCTLDAVGKPTSCPTIIQDNMTTGAGTNGALILWTCAAGGTHHQITNIHFEDGGRASRGVEENNGIIAIDCVNTGGTTFKIDHNRFEDLYGWNIRPYTVVGSIDHNVFTTIQPSTTLIYVFHPDWNVALDADDWGDHSWADPPVWGALDDFLFIETNTMTVTGTDITCIDGVRGTRHVYRFNVTARCRISNHGTESGFRARSGVAMEIYANVMDNTGGSSVSNKMTNIRGGSMLHWGNVGTNFPGTPVAATMDLVRAFSCPRPWTCSYGDMAGNLSQFDMDDGTNPQDPDPGGPCTGGASGKECTVASATSTTVTVTGATFPDWSDYVIRKAGCTYTSSPWVNCHTVITNTNANVITFLSDTSPHGNFAGFAAGGGDNFTIVKVDQYLDSIGRTGGTLLVGGSSTAGDPPALPVGPPYDQTTSPIYAWLNTEDGANIALSNTADSRAVANNTHYYNYVAYASFDCLTGVSSGTRAQMDAKSGCTAGVGFWVIDEGGWNTNTVSRYTGDYTGQGRLYIWTAGAWLLSYTPAVYPNTYVADCTASILDFTGQPSAAPLGESIGTLTVAITNGSQTCTNYTNTVTVAPTSGAPLGTLNGTTAVAAVAGVATFSTLNITGTGGTYSLDATASGLSTDTSNNFVIGCTSVSLSFTSQPSSTAVGLLLGSVQVAVRCTGGAITNLAATNSITIALGGGSPAGTLNGTLTAAAVNGVATFANLNITVVQGAYTLAATTSGLTSATSNSFTISDTGGGGSGGRARINARVPEIEKQNDDWNDDFYDEFYDFY